MKILSVVLMFLLLILDGCVSVARRNVVYEPDVVNGNAKNVSTGRLLSSQFSVLLTPLLLIPQWRGNDLVTYGNMEIKFTSPVSPECPSVEMNGRFYFMQLGLYDVVRKTAVCNSSYLPMTKDVETVNIYFRDEKYSVIYRRKSDWFLGFCGYSEYCEGDYGDDFVWGKSK